MKPAFTEEQLHHYFIQFWAITNPEILTIDELRKVLFKIYCEVAKEISESESKLFYLNQLYKERIIKGKQYDNKLSFSFKRK